MCPCGTLVDAKESHDLSCKHSAGRSIRHHQLNDLIWRALTRASIPSVKESAALSCTDGKRPDGLSRIPWQGGKCPTWDVTVANSLAATCLCEHDSWQCHRRSCFKEGQQILIAQSHVFVPLAIETLGPPINCKGLKLISELSDRLTAATDDPREASFLFQRISIIIQRFNAVCFQGTFTQHEEVEF